MTQSLEERLGYHPDPRHVGRGDRPTEPRLAAIQSKIDFRDKTVLDLGCSGGFFSFALSKLAKRVIAVDGDAEVIERNRAIQRDLRITNIEFRHANIDAALVRSVAPVDVTLLLSVYHHMLTRSAAYDWNSAATAQGSGDVIDAIGESTKTFVFEIGWPNEGYEWCARLPDFGSDWDAYIRRTIFRGRFPAVEAVGPRSGMSWINRHLVSKLSRPYREDGMLVQRIKSALRYESRDFRTLYFGTK